MDQPATHPLRYVVLRHEGVDRPHYDLLFETSARSMLAAWRAESWPVRDGDEVEAIAEHRRAYLDYEGPLSGSRGTVKRIHAGRYAMVQNDGRELVVRLDDGSVLQLPRESIGKARVSST